MNTRCMIPARLAALVVMIAALFLASATAQAQLVDCSVCDSFTVAGNRFLACSVTICYSTPSSPIDICQTVGAGQSIKIPCTANQVWVSTCSGSYSIVPASSTARCSPPLKFAAGCCGQICNVPNVDICTKLEIQPLPCSSTSCP